MLKPGRDDRAFKIVQAAMLHRKPEIIVKDAGPRSGLRGRNDDESSIDLLPPVHPGGVFLADEAALGETHAVQFRRIALEPQQVGEFLTAFADAEMEAMLQPAMGVLVRLTEPAAAQFRKP